MAANIVSRRSTPSGRMQNALENVAQTEARLSGDIAYLNVAQSELRSVRTVLCASTSKHPPHDSHIHYGRANAEQFCLPPEAAGLGAPGVHSQKPVGGSSVATNSVGDTIAFGEHAYRLSSVKPQPYFCH